MKKMKTQKSNPIAVLISDIHFTLGTLELASSALSTALQDAKARKLSLVICGDTLDAKAIIRAEIANRLINLLSNPDNPKIYLIVGNHDMCNEKGKEHALNFLQPYCDIVSHAKEVVLGEQSVWLFPYFSDREEFARYIQHPHCSDLVIGHQGVLGGNPGHYIQDPGAIDPEILRGKRFITGHYHAHQVEENYSYVGTPYTITFGEANDPPKGYCLLNSDGSLTHVPLNLRKHIIVERTTETLAQPIINYVPGDLLWFKLTGSRMELDQVERENVAKALGISEGFKFDKICTDSNVVRIDQKVSLSNTQMLDKIIDTSLVDDPEAVKSLYRELM